MNKYQAKLIKISQLQHCVGLLSHAIHTGIKPTVKYQLARVWECVLDLLPEESKESEVWRKLTEPQVVFIEPEAIHAFIKLQSQISAFITASYHDHPQGVSLAHIKHFIEFICDQYSIKVSEVIK